MWRCLPAITRCALQCLYGVGVGGVRREENKENSFLDWSHSGFREQKVVSILPGERAHSIHSVGHVVV